MQFQSSTFRFAGALANCILAVVLLAGCGSSSTDIDVADPVAIRAIDQLEAESNQSFQLSAELITQPGTVGEPVVAWVQSSGPGTVLFDIPSALSTSAVADQPGTYTITLQVTQGTSETEHSITLLVAAEPVSIRAVDQLEAESNQSFQLSAELVTQSGVIAEPAVAWVQSSGPGTVLFDMPSALSTSAVADQPGTYTITLQVTQGTSETEHSITLLVANPIINSPPVVSIIAEDTVLVGSTLALDAMVEDDGLPDSSLSYSWSSDATPGTVTFTESSLLQTDAIFSAVGGVQLTLNVSDGELDTQATHSVDVQAIPEPEPTIDAALQWQLVNSADGSEPQARHEAGAVVHDGRLYLLGGRGMRQVNSYNPTTNVWQSHGVPGFEFNHFQPVVYDDKIYVIGALSCCYPSEDIIPVIKIFDPATNSWSDGATIPTNRRRGSAGAVVHDNKIYIVAGTTNGHSGGMVRWFDEYDPATNTWKTMPDALTARDHFSAVVVQGKLVAAGGRQSTAPATWSNRVAAVDVFDFQTGQWQAGTAIPTTRAGAMTIGVGEEVIVIGGEQNLGAAAANAVESYNVRTDSWRTLSPLNVTRHGGGVGILENGVHVVSGNINAGGGAETTSHEFLPGAY